MTLYKPGDVVLVKFPFTSGAGSKLRPALVILDTGDDDLVVARITTHTSLTLFDVVVVDWRGAGLLAPSNARLHKLATIEKSDIHRSLGHLQPTDSQRVAAVLRRFLDQW
jgi:mRNA interferase MazF